jgi:hypothetical protein
LRRRWRVWEFAADSSAIGAGFFQPNSESDAHAVTHSIADAERSHGFSVNGRF